jgi:hypothetical protein
MVDVKISASFTLQGSVLPAEPPCSKKGKKKRKKEEKKKEILYRQEVISLENKKQIVINLREAVPAKQNLHLSTDAYNYMVSVENPVEGIKVYEWKKLTPNKRVKYHLQVIAESLNAKLESFTVLED